MREDLIRVFEDTENFIKENPILQRALYESRKNTVMYSGRQIPEKEKLKFLSNVYVSRSKTFEAARLLAKKETNKKIAVLNFASATNPGGGVKRGASAQEESLCRCSTLYHCLAQDRMFKQFYIPNRTDETRTSLHTDDIIYTPNVIICRDDSSNVRLEEKDFTRVDVITCAAPNLRDSISKYNPDERDPIPVTSISDEELLQLHKNRARNIFEAALLNHVDILILGAFGCGAFRNDPYIVARAYKEVLEEYANKFELIEFAIYCSGPDKNYTAFQSVLGE